MTRDNNVNGCGHGYSSFGANYSITGGSTTFEMTMGRNTTENETIFGYMFRFYKWKSQERTYHPVCCFNYQKRKR